MRKLRHDEIRAQRHESGSLQQLGRLPVAALIDNVRSLYNVGSIFRTSDAIRLGKLYLCGYTPHPPRKEIEKTALGATHTVPWEYFKRPEDAVDAAKREGYRICLLEQTTGSRPYTELTPADLPLCLVVGNEIAGISEQVIGLGDMAIDIPMKGLKQSLNVSVAFGIAAYHIALTAGLQRL